MREVFTLTGRAMEVHPMDAMLSNPFFPEYAVCRSHKSPTSSTQLLYHLSFNSQRISAHLTDYELNYRAGEHASLVSGAGE